MIALRPWYAGRRVLVTGHTGFKGSWLTAWLRDMGAKVTGFSLAPEFGERSLFHDAHVADGVDSCIGDIRDREAIAGVLKAAKPEIVLHLAAQSLVRRSYREPATTFDTNVMGVVNLLDAVRAADCVQSVVIVTSDKCYENAERDHRYREHDPMGGHDPYSASKACAELVTASYRRSFLSSEAVPVATARAGNVIGGGDWSQDRLIPDLMRGAERDQPVAIRNPHAVRPWQHVLEPLRGYLLLAQALSDVGAPFAEAWNFGPAPSDARPVAEIVAMLQQEWSRVQIVLERSADAPHEAGLLSLDASKAAERLGCEPRLPLPTALEWTASWYRDYFADPTSAAALIQRDIVRYEGLV